MKFLKEAYFQKALLMNASARRHIISIGDNNLELHSLVITVFTLLLSS